MNVVFLVLSVLIHWVTAAAQIYSNKPYTNTEILNISKYKMPNIYDIKDFSFPGTVDEYVKTFIIPSEHFLQMQELCKKYNSLNDDVIENILSGGLIQTPSLVLCVLCAQNIFFYLDLIQIVLLCILANCIVILLMWLYFDKKVKIDDFDFKRDSSHFCFRNDYFPVSEETLKNNIYILSCNYHLQYIKCTIETRYYVKKTMCIISYLLFIPIMPLILSIFN